MENVKSFANAKEFNEIFGINPTTGARKNKILLALLKCKVLWRLRKQPLYAPFFNGVMALRSQTELFELLQRQFNMFMPRAIGDKDCVHFSTEFFKAENFRYATDKSGGLCEDGDYTKIRVKITDNGKTVVRKTSPGKVLRQIIKDTQYAWLPDCVVTYLCEKFTEKWIAYAENEIGNMELVVDDDFEQIYDGDICDGDFASCMTDRYESGFYEYCVDAKAASLRRGDKILARCVIFTNVLDENNGKRYRLAERQYAVNQDNKLKQILVNKLIDGGYIDGYKDVGVGCHSPYAFTLNDGTPLRRDLSISCEDAESCIFVPYMDTFKWYSPSESRAYNYNDESTCDYAMEETDGDMERIFEKEALRDGYWETITNREELANDYVLVDGTYVYYENIHHCAWCDEECYEGDCSSKFSYHLGEYFCCHDCMCSALLNNFLDDYDKGNLSATDTHEARNVIYIDNGTEEETFFVCDEIYIALNFFGLMDNNNYVDLSAAREAA